MILSCKQIQKSYGIDAILDNVTFHMEEKEKVAVVGVNGAGKTTLFRILTDNETKDGGEIYLKKEATMAYMAQNQEVEGNATVYDTLLSVFLPIIEMEKRLREMEERMATETGEALKMLMGSYESLQQEFEKKDGYSYQSRLRGVIKGLGFTEDDFNRPLSELSGGQKTRIYLGKLLLSKPDLLLLDEPTNHLDISAIEWLEDFLKSYDGAVLLISHDRYFLDKIVSKVVEIENRKANTFNGNYSTYTEQKDIRRAIEQKAFDMQQKELKHHEDVIKTLRQFNREKSVKRADSREKALNKVDRLDRPESLPNHMRLALTPQIMSGNDVLHVEELKKSFGDAEIFRNVSFSVFREEKVAIIGANGVGKSTLFKILLGIVEKDSGRMRLGTNVHIGYYDQEQAYLDESKTIFQEIADHHPTLTAGQIRNVLAAFVFTNDDVFKVISTLSGGEKGRVSLAKIMLSKANCLFLDEPTNHLDMYSKEVLENAIECYEGTAIYISHDRYFINKTAEKILELTPEGVNVYAGNYDYYLEKKAEKHRNAIEQKEMATEKNTTTQPQEAISDTKLDWKKQKEVQAQQRKLAGQIAKVEKEIEEVETAIAKADADMVALSSDYAKAQEVFEEKTKLEERLEVLYETWEELQ
ncbi:MAG: ABC-F family ATP-binding cassette domain-containing protein [Bacillota bacterium]